MSTDFVVTGMTCGHCVASVTEEVQEVAGVTDVQVDLATGALRVQGEHVDDAAVLAAVEVAGYEAVAS